MSVLTYVLDANNLARATGVTVTASTSATGYGASNLKELPVSSTWRSTGTGSATIDIDLGSAQEVSLAALVNHNLQRSATVSIQGASNSGFTSDVVTWNNPENEIRNLWTLQDTAASRRYWRFQIDDSGNPDGFYRAGYIVLGKALKFPQQFAQGWERNPVKVIRKNESDLGSSIVGRVISRGWRLAFTWELDNADTLTVERVLDSLDGDPLFMIPVPSSPHGFFVRLENAAEPWTCMASLPGDRNELKSSFMTDNDTVA